MSVISWATVYDTYGRFMRTHPKVNLLTKNNPELENIIHEVFNAGWQAAMDNEDMRNTFEQR